MKLIAKAELYLSYLDRILAGEKDIGPVEDAEIAKLFRLAQSMYAVDFSVQSEIRETLRKQLLDQISPRDKSILAIILEDKPGSDDELMEADLDYVTAGWEGQAEENICPCCGARLNKFQRKCPLCHR